ncbi:hypothetical protein AB0E69_07085 [Kribbella sp. NPDC026611]|uniref:hypothetical protein n=1 Tax=Kribbella sp. NPDC026611 TaxID=3154911 RepID=UPI0033D4BA27
MVDARPVTELHEVVQQAVFAFSTYTVTLHTVGPASALPVGTDDARQRALASYEDDMFLYVYRADAPFRTYVVANQEPVTIHFATEVEYESEDKKYVLVSPGAPARHDVEASVTGLRTVFPGSGISILHTVLSGTGEPGAELSEYELIKLAKLWQGGEGLADAGRAGSWVSFSGLGHAELGFGDLVRALFGDPSLDDRMRTGTVEVESPLSARENQQVVEDVATLQSGDAAGLRTLMDADDRWDRLVSIGGLLQGLLDFKKVDRAELRDVVKEAKLDGEHLLGFHKGTLLSVQLPTEQEDRYTPIPANPYLVIPHAVILHNEERLKNARAMGLALPAGQLDILGPHRRRLSWSQRRDAAFRRPISLDGQRRLVEQDRRGVPASRPGQRVPLVAALKVAAGGRVEELADHRLVGPLSIKHTVVGLRDASDVFAHRLPNVFHYGGERWVFRRGHSSRGLGEFESMVRLRLDEISNDVDGRIKRRDASTIVIAITFPVLSALQAAVSEKTEWVPAWIFPIIAVLVILSLILWRLRI